MSYVVDIIPVLNANGLFDIRNLTFMDLIELEKAIKLLNSNRENNRNYQRRKSGNETGGATRTVTFNLVLPFTRRSQPVAESQQHSYTFQPIISQQQPITPLTLNVMQ